MTDWNQNTIEEFRANEGKVGGYFEGRPILLLHHKGAQSGVERVNPVMYETLDNGFAVFASKAGADTNPDWYHNFKANPETTVEVGSETIPVKARIADPQEREPIWRDGSRPIPTSPSTRRRLREKSRSSSSIAASSGRRR